MGLSAPPNPFPLFSFVFPMGLFSEKIAEDEQRLIENQSYHEFIPSRGLSTLSDTTNGLSSCLRL